MDSWILKSLWFVFKYALTLWYAPFWLAEGVAVAAGVFMLIGVVGEYVAEHFEKKKLEKVSKLIKRLSMSVLVLGLAGDVLGIVMGQAEMSALIQEAGDASNSAKIAQDDAETATRRADDANTSAGHARTKADAADTSAKDANREAKEAEIDAQSAKRDAKELSAALKLEQRRIDIEWLFQQSGRSLGPEQLNLLRETGPKGGGNVDVKYALEREQGPEYFARAISATLKDAGWMVPNKLFFWPGDPPAPGVTIRNKWTSLPEFSHRVQINDEGDRYVEIELPISLLLGATQSNGRSTYANGLSNDEARRLAILWIGLGASLEKDDNMQGYEFRIVVGPEKPAAGPATKK